MATHRQKLVKKYGGEKKFKAEMKARRAKVKSYHLQDNPEFAKEISNKRWEKQRAKKESE